MLAALLTAALVPLSAATAVPQQSYDFVSTILFKAAFIDRWHDPANLDCCGWRYSRWRSLRVSAKD